MNCPIAFELLKWKTTYKNKIEEAHLLTEDKSDVRETQKQTALLVFLQIKQYLCCTGHTCSSYAF